MTIMLKTRVPFLKPRSHCPGVSPGASRQFVAGGPGQTKTNREGIRVRSYIPGSATDQTRFEKKSDHGLFRCYAVAYDYQWNSPGSYNRYVIYKVQNSSYITKQIRTAIREGEICYVVSNETLPFYPLFSLIHV